MDVWSKDGCNVQCHALDVKKIFDLMKNTISNVVELTEVSSEDARSLLALYNWNKEKAVEAYFNLDQYELFKEAGIVIPDLDSILFDGEPRSTGTCEICFCDFEDGKSSTAGCGHYFCNDCWKNYLKVKIFDESEGENVRCPSNNCPQRVPSHVVMSASRDPKIFMKHQELCAMAFAEANKYMKRCPAADCKLVIKISESEPLHCSVTCPCGNRFCFGCYQYAHDPISCSRLKIWQEFTFDSLKLKVRNEEENLRSEQVLRGMKRCPKCRIPVEKIDGCNHVTCTRKCAYQFCWVCLGPWATHGNAFNCNAYVSVLPTESLPLSEAVAKLKLECFEFHKGRYDNHVRSIELEKKHRATIRQKFIESKNCEVPFRAAEVDLIRNALDTLLRSRLILAHSYIFAFYVEECKLLDIYLVNQAILERATEKLTDYFQNVFSDADIGSVKVHLPILDNQCSFRIEAMLNHIADGYEKGLWQFSQ